MNNPNPKFEWRIRILGPKIVRIRIANLNFSIIIYTTAA